MNLTAKQEAFARAYVANGGNATRAAIKAGYSERSARFVGAENLTKPNIRDFIDSLKKPVNESLGITAEWVRSRLREEAMAKRSPATARIRALELIGKDLGMFTGESGEDEDRTWTIEIETIDVGSTDEE